VADERGASGQPGLAPRTIWARGWGGWYAISGMAKLMKVWGVRVVWAAGGMPGTTPDALRAPIDAFLLPLLVITDVSSVDRGEQ